MKPLVAVVGTSKTTCGLLRPGRGLVAALVLVLSACAGTEENSNNGGAAGMAASSGGSNGGSNSGSNSGPSTAGSSSGGGGVQPMASAGSSSPSTAGQASGGVDTGGHSGSGGNGGMGGTPPVAVGGNPPASERCEIANYDPAKPPQTLALSGSLGTHDPVIMVADGRFYLFSTGNNVGAKTSTNMLQWQAASDVFTGATRPTWLAEAVPGVSNLWAPDISFFGGVYHLYYSASTFGSNRSCIGHLTRASLTTGNWADRGQVICSNASATKENWNAIDPNVIVDQAGTPWLSFGSFWGGIKLIKLDAEGARVGTSLDSLAARPGASGAVEAPFIVRRCGFYYLFVSWDTCCKGAASTYNTRVGRSPTVTGPYVDKNGVALIEGGGTLLVQGGERYKGPGHNAVVFTDKAAFNVYHSYDASSNGASVLRISELVWDNDGWPISAGP